MTTFKIHCIPDYPAAVRRYGTTDSYSTQTSELTHRLSKVWYRMSNKNRGFLRQITNKEIRTRFYDTMCQELAKDRTTSTPTTVGSPHLHPAPESEDVPSSDPSERYQMPKAYSSIQDLGEWLHENRGDPALRVSLRTFGPCFTNVDKPRIRRLPYTGDEHDFTDLDRDTILIDHNRLYEHKTIWFRSTTYNVRRMEETANPRTHADIMVLSHEDRNDAKPAFPYWHAQIVGIYHIMVRQKGQGGIGLTDPSRMDILLVRWLGLDSGDGHSGWRAQRMHSVGFLPDTDALGPAFGFLDPSEVIRMVHLIPDFCSGRTTELLSRQSLAIQTHHPDGEYKQYYVAMFSDRDLFMRYRGGGVGHLGTRQCNEFLLADEHRPINETQDADEPLAELEESQGSDSESEGEDEGVSEGEDEGESDRGEDDNDDELVLAASNDLDIVTAVGLAAL
ncbi:hypothetical protein EDB84DRAFT_1566683 [Lactarius hengduanensis]|nr:hypothetical protein EDB84DRAFT_1566683 [Lactarius hengduanensis]